MIAQATSCDLLSEFLTLHQQQQRSDGREFLQASCDLLSEFLTLHQQQQRRSADIGSNNSCDLLSEFLTLHQQQQLIVLLMKILPVVICFQNF